MLNLDEAKRIVSQNMPEGRIQKYIVYKDLFVFQIFTDDLLEGIYDPFYSVNRKTSEFQGFPLMQPGVFTEVMNLFAKIQ